MAANRAAALFVIAAVAAHAHDPITTKLTWSREISRIVYKHCAGCHRPGGPTPMSLLDYAEARPWAKAIKEEVLERRMPPSGAMKGYGEFRDAVSLSQEEMHLVADWVEGGAPKGDSAYLPAKPKPAPTPRVSVTRRLPVRILEPFTMTAIRVEGLAEGDSVRVAAVTRSGIAIPLVWIPNYRPKWSRAYVYREPLRLPAGTRIVSTNPAARLFTRPSAVPEP
ncbi:MAG: hypothetical protein R2729_14835 [Bryobacteraceae bacterium]